MVSAVAARSSCADDCRTDTKSDPLAVMPMPSSSMITAAAVTIVCVMSVPVTAARMGVASFGYWNKCKCKGGRQRCNRAEGFYHFVSLVTNCSDLPAGVVASL
jgi:hypothetical protein